jgi:hypothetical protein
MGSGEVEREVTTMRILRGLGGALLWILASVLGLVAVLLCVTLILLPVGIPLLRLAGRMYGNAVRLMLPRAVAHPVKETGRRGRRKGQAIADDVGGLTKRSRKKARALSKKGGKLGHRRRKALPV